MELQKPYTLEPLIKAERRGELCLILELDNTNGVDPGLEQMGNASAWPRH